MKKSRSFDRDSQRSASRLSLGKSPARVGKFPLDELIHTLEHGQETQWGRSGTRDRRVSYETIYGKQKPSCNLDLPGGLQ